MQHSDRAELARLVGLLAETFGRAVSAVTIEAYWLGLQEISIEGIRHGVRRCLGTARFMPTPAEIREAAGDTPPKARAELAWETALRAVRRIGGYSSPDFEDRAINAAIRGLGGWNRFTELEGDELHTYTRHAFLQAYAAWSANSAGEAGDHLAGIHELSDKGRGRQVRVECPYLPPPERKAISAATERAPLAAPQVPA